MNYFTDEIETNGTEFESESLSESEEPVHGIQDLYRRISITSITSEVRNSSKSNLLISQSESSSSACETSSSVHSTKQEVFIEENTGKVSFETFTREELLKRLKNLVNNSTEDPEVYYKNHSISKCLNISIHSYPCLAIRPRNSLYDTAKKHNKNVKWKTYNTKRNSEETYLKSSATNELLTPLYQPVDTLIHNWLLTCFSVVKCTENIQIFQPHFHNSKENLHRDLFTRQLSRTCLNLKLTHEQPIIKYVCHRQVEYLEFPIKRHTLREHKREGDWHVSMGK